MEFALMALVLALISGTCMRGAYNSMRARATAEQQRNGAALGLIAIFGLVLLGATLGKLLEYANK